ncbi:hypothetical protein GALMADRAFT_162482 [Galerina marginata CBS 339.88]|uniref:Uncharacterized protein n=1 Tax=Galerina marginata (strain CBS 339.88) TaxID=685588 RepID=A0A067SEB5_GALM3|nr:hypothetical protein GALMADRAFT_162482 [Galerina marginata CBS 339.88]
MYSLKSGQSDERSPAQPVWFEFKKSFSLTDFITKPGSTTDLRRVGILRQGHGDRVHRFRLVASTTEPISAVVTVMLVTNSITNYFDKQVDRAFVELDPDEDAGVWDLDEAQPSPWFVRYQYVGKSGEVHETVPLPREERLLGVEYSVYIGVLPLDAGDTPVNWSVECATFTRVNARAISKIE